MLSLPNTTYIIIGRCLAPSLPDEQRKSLANLLSRNDIRWDKLLSEANRQQCTPLWYVRLKENGLLHLLPEDLQAYLAELTAANGERNQRLREELLGILAIFAGAGIPVILINGMAAFADGLYADEDARLIDTMDLLVPQEQVREAERLLMMEGYVDAPAKSSIYGHQGRIPTLYHMRKTTAVNLHFAVAGGPVGSAMDTKAAWQTAFSGQLGGLPVKWPAPAWRLLHNARNATQYRGAFLRGSLRLADLAEFCALLERYREDIAPNWFWARVSASELLPEITTYARLVQRLTGEDIFPPPNPKTQWHLNRIAASHTHALAGTKCGQRWQACLWRMQAWVYSLAKFPGWTWQNACSGRMAGSRLGRLGCFARRILNPHHIRSALKAQIS
jgi:hypothetical protein